MLLSIRKHPTVSYFGLTYLISWAGALVLVLPFWINKQPAPAITGWITFPVMLLGPSITGVVLTRLVNGRAGMTALGAGLGRWRLGRWYAFLLLPPLLMWGLLSILGRAVSPVFMPNLFLVGIPIGLLPGFLEEIGWTGFVLPYLVTRFGWIKASLLLGILWGLWHLPAVDYLGAASPHGSALPWFALMFVVAMTAMRVIMVWVYKHTKSILLMQLLHASSTASLVVFGAMHTKPWQEALWYGLYGLLLWIVALALILSTSRRLNSGQDLSHNSL